MSPKILDSTYCCHNIYRVQVVAAGANPVLITRGIEKTSKALVAELKAMSKEVFVTFYSFPQHLYECNLLLA